MRSLKGEVVLNIPTEKAWELYKDNNIISERNNITSNLGWVARGTIIIFALFLYVKSKNVMQKLK